MNHKQRFSDNLNCLQTHQPHLAKTIPSVPCSSIATDAIETLKKPSAHPIPESADFLYWLGSASLDTLQQMPSTFLRQNRGILVIEPSLQRFMDALHGFDLAPLFQSRKIFWAVGPDADRQVQSLLDRTLAFAAQAPHVIHADTTINRDDWWSWLRNEIAVRMRSWQDDLERLKAHSPSPNAEGYRLWSFEDLRGVASYSTIQHTLMRTLFHFLRSIGHTVGYTVLRPGHYYPPYYRILQMARFRPDALVLCNKSPSYDTVLGRSLTHDLNIPSITWYADDPFFAEHFLDRNGLSPREYFLMADYDWFHTLQKYDAHSVTYMPGAATSMRRGRYRSRHACDVVFVGQVRDLRPFFDRLTVNWRHYCEQVIQEKLRFPRKNVRAIMNQFTPPASIPPDHEDDLRQKILWEANTRFRLRLVQEASRYGLHLFGNRDWLALLPRETGKRVYKGVLQPRRLFTVYRSAQIVLNIHSLQSNSCLNVRDFDVAAAGGFLLSDWMPRAEEIFRPGFVNNLPVTESSPNEVFFYRSIAEMHTLITHFLHAPEERDLCITKARTRLEAGHTYAHRAREVDQTLRHAVRECSDSER